jgi:ABC-type iron transport system FetAB ATPase subunit
MNDAVIEVNDLMIRLDDHRTMGPLTFRLAKGQKAVVQGRSGCGKSTLLKCVLGFVQPQQGTVVIQGTRLSAATVWGLRRHLAYVAQEPELGWGSVRSVLERPFNFHGNRSLRDNLQQVPHWLERFHLPLAILDKETSTLSGGEKQRVALISVILLERMIFLLDEVTSALDKESSAAVMAFFSTASEVTALFVSHDATPITFANLNIHIPDPGERPSS